MNIFLIDAFTCGDIMRELAFETGISETVFVKEESGHSTLAAAFVPFSQYDDLDGILFTSGSGIPKAKQLSYRTGELDLQIKDNRLFVTGDCAEILSGELKI